VFDVSRQVLMLDIEEGRVVARREETLPGTELQDQACRLTVLGPQVLICGAISQPLTSLLVAASIRVIPFTAGDVDQVLGAWLVGTLPNPALTMPGCCGLRRGCRGKEVRRRNVQAYANTAVNCAKGNNMKIAITATGKDVSSNVDLRFGRAKYFIVVDTESDNAVVHDNTQNLNAAQGAGIQSAETVARLGAEAVITGNAGPKAFRTLNAAGIKVYLCPGGTVAEAIRSFKDGELKEATAANVDGHWA